MPFGRVDNADVDRLQEFAVKRGFDLKADIARVYAGQKIDEDALGRVFTFAREFNTLDKTARTYIPVICTGGFRTADGILKALSASCDAVSIARPLLANPNLPNLVERRMAWTEGPALLLL